MTGEPSDIPLEFTIAKVDAEQRIIGGFISVCRKADGSLAADSQGDVIDTPEAIADWHHALLAYARDVRDGDLQHEVFKASRLVEFVVYTPDLITALAKRLGLTAESQFVGAYASYHFPPGELGDAAIAGAKEALA